MKRSMLNNRSGSSAGRSEVATSGVSRRNFLMGAGLVAGAMLVRPAHALPGLTHYDNRWKQSVCRLVDHICPEPVAGRIREAIYGATTYNVTPSSNFHGSFSSTKVIDLRVNPEPTYGDRYFELASLPYYDSRNPPRRAKDLNALEIERILNGGEREHFGGVVSPCSERRQVASCGCERDVYNKTFARYRLEPADWEPVYARNFTDGRRSYLGFAVRSRTNGGKELLLSPDSV